MPYVPIEIQEAGTRKLVKLILKIIACLGLGCFGMIVHPSRLPFIFECIGGTEPNFTEEWAKSGHPTVIILAALANSSDLCHLLIGIY